MSARIAATFDRLAADRRRGFIAYLTAGDPTMQATVERVAQLFDAGADLVELGLPFSDPLADGRVNAESAARALAAGVRLDDVVEGVRAIRRFSDAPLVIYSYLNPLLAPGFERSVGRLASAGVDGLLVLDLPVEEAGEFLPALRSHAIAPIFLVTPTSTDERMRRIAACADGFVYCVSRTGVTGVRNELAPDATQVVRRMRRHTRLPLALGFGISTPEMVRAAAGLADAVVVGSGLVDRLHRSEGSPREREAVWAWVRSMASAAHASGGARHGSHARA